MTNFNRLLCSLLLCLLPLSVIAKEEATSEFAEFAEFEFSGPLQDKLSTLSEAQLTFLLSDKVRPYARSPEALNKVLERKSAAEIAAYVDAMIWVQEQSGFVEGRDAASIRLNTQSPEFNAWKTRRPRSFDPDREAGPITLSRYMRGRLGIPTFANAPVALTQEDLIAGKVEVAIVGAPLNMGSGWRDADHGPLALRLLGRMSGNDQYTMINAT